MVTKRASRKYPVTMPALAKKLRKDAIPAERKLWFLFQQLRLSEGIRFRRQQPVGPFIADFYCAAQKLIVEIDGFSHESREPEDHERDLFVNALGIRVLRFTEKEAGENPEQVVETILEFLRSTPPLTPPFRLRSASFGGQAFSKDPPKPWRRRARGGG